MIFNEEEIIAVAKLGIMMIEADFVTLKSETDKLIADIKRFSAHDTDAEDVMKRAHNLNHINMISTISNFDNDKKRITAAILMDLMDADKNIDKEEIAMLNFASEVCHLPYVPLEDARKIICKL